MTIEILLMLSLNMVSHLISIFELKLSPIMVLKRNDGNPKIESPYSDMKGLKSIVLVNKSKIK